MLQQIIDLLNRSVARANISGAITVLDSSTIVLVSNAKRKFFTVINDSDTVIYLALGKVAVVNEGIRLNANGGNASSEGLSVYTGDVSAISSVTSKVLTVVEG